MSSKAEVIYESQCILGESPMWHASRKSCFWVDIENGILYEYGWTTRKIKTWKFNHRLPLVVQGKRNNVIISLDGTIARFHLKTRKTEFLSDVVADPEIRCNDGDCDSKGRLWIGTMHLKQHKGAGALYRIDKDLKINKKWSGTTVSNGIAWSPDNRRMYFIDSPTQKVQSFYFDEKTGDITFEKDAIIIPTDMGAPDGMAIDEEGMLWIAHWGGFGIYRWNPHNGQLLEKIKIPVPQASSCAFVGENLDYLIITTARENMKDDELKKYPASGNVFLVKIGVKGILPNKCLI
jgi:sugar lactone lactonase YvrE